MEEKTTIECWEDLEENTELISETEDITGEKETLEEKLLAWQKDLAKEADKLLDERAKFEDEMEQMSRQMEGERKRLQMETSFFDQKMNILKGGFEQLEMDRKRLEKERIHFEAKRDVLRKSGERSKSSESVSLFFKGVENPLTLKKRYKDLIKIFHPDNICGDTDIIQMINKEYEILKTELRCFKKA